MATAQDTSDFVNNMLHHCGDAIEAQLREQTCHSELKYEKEKVKRLEDRIKAMDEKMSEHFDRRARYIYLKQETQNVLLAMHQQDSAMAKNSYDEIHKRVHAQALEKLQTFKAAQKQAQADFDNDEAVAAAQHRVECANALQLAREKLANVVFDEATRHVAEMQKQMRKRGREDVEDMNEYLANAQKAQKSGPEVSSEEAPAPMEEAPAAAEAPAVAEAPAEDAEPHPGTLGVKAPKTIKPKQTDAEKAAAKAERERLAQAKKDAAKAERERLAQIKKQEAEEKRAKAKAEKERMAEEKRAEKEKKANGKKKETPAASAAAPVGAGRFKGGKAAKEGLMSAKQYWQGLDSTKTQYANETMAAEEKGGTAWANWYKNSQAWFEDAWARVPASEKKWLAKKAQGDETDSDAISGGETKGAKGVKGTKGAKGAEGSKEEKGDEGSKEGKADESESEAEVIDDDDAPEQTAAREDKPQGDSVREPDSDKEEGEQEGEGDDSDDDSDDESDDDNESNDKKAKDKKKSSTRASPRAKKSDDDGDDSDNMSSSG